MPQSLGPVSQAIGLARHLLGASHCASRQPLALCASLLYSSCPLARPSEGGPWGRPSSHPQRRGGRRTAISSRPWPDSSVGPTPERDTALLLPSQPRCCLLPPPPQLCCCRLLPARRRNSALQALPALGKSIGRVTALGRCLRVRLPLRSVRGCALAFSCMRVVSKTPSARIRTRTF
eukprot:SM000271S10033  [mRNA]  locus=s271:128824:129416:- [translate_table: standard]